MEADIILLSDSIFTARTGEVHANPGAIAIRGNRIIKVGDRATVNSFKGTGTKIYELGDRTVCPGFIDNHQFFTGFALKRWGPDVAGVRAENALEILKKYASGLSPEWAVVGHGLSVEGWSEKEKS
ncbi:MAG TPA: hypothetical protein VHR42_03260 [Clostridia bacterium]|nr:hypothetical protein [Clostridia bacterium]